MANSIPDYTQKVLASVRSYWDVRASQAQRSADSGAINTGLRSEVTGGRHLDELQLLLVDVFVDGPQPGPEGVVVLEFLVAPDGGEGGEGGAGGGKATLPGPPREVGYHAAEHDGGRRVCHTYLNIICCAKADTIPLSLFF